MINVITHFDWDGWCSAAILKETINPANITFTSNKNLLKTLNFIVNSYKNHSKNIIFILDISIPMESSNSLFTFFKRFRNNNIKFLWIDHHVEIDDIQYLNKFRNVEIIINSEAYSTASMIPELITIKKIENIQKFIDYSEFPSQNSESNYWYTVLNNIKRNKFHFAYWTIVKIIFNLFSALKRDKLSDYFYELKKDYEPNHYKKFKTMKGRDLLLIDKFKSKKEAFQVFKDYDLMLIYYNDEKIGCYSKNIALKPLYSLFNAKGHASACVFSPFIVTKNNFTRFLNEKEVVGKCIELF